MRKRDKLKNIEKANLLAERRYLKSKNLLTEDIMGELEYGILEGYLEAAFWTEEEELEGKSIRDLDPESRDLANEDILKFINLAGDLLEGLEPDQIGHDLWLTRNGHGAGFWDRGLDEKGELLSDIARKMGQQLLYIGDDGKVHLTPSQGNQKETNENESIDKDLNVTKAKMVIMSHLSDIQETNREDSLKINFVKYLILKYDNLNVDIDADKEFTEFSKKQFGDYRQNKF